jgi:hypothetical protein
MFRAAVTGFVGCLVIAASACRAEDPADEWITLFDGKTLNGWKASESPENWAVVDGAIAGHGSRSHLFYVDREFKNFEFQTDVMINKGGNSGIYFHSRLEEGWPSFGYESQVNNSHRDPVKTGSLYNTVKVFESAAKDDEWWTQSIVVMGRSVTVKVNGKTLFEYVEPEGVEGPRRLGKGLFAFQQHDPGSMVKYKNVKVRALPDGE